MNNLDDEKTGLWRARERMVRTHLMARGIQDEVVLKAMSRIPREAFIPEALRDRAYDDTPLPIGDGQTISQPFIVALMTQTLELAGGEKILEIGTGSGYQAAMLGQICQKVFSIERSYTLSARARRVLEELGYTNILLRVGDGTVGWAEFSPYDRIVVTAAAPTVPKTLSQQLKIGGRMVVPVGERTQQELLIIKRTETDFETESAGPCVFVPLIGREGWTS
jgi:protein-L-isoaspartate(D-aspartate) O-methyltransferase